MSKCRFKTVMKIRGINPFVEVSAERVADVKPGWRKPLPVLVRIDGKPQNAHRTNMMPVGDGSFYLYLNDIVRRAARVGVGDRVDVEIEFDAGYRNGPQHSMPASFRAALKKNPEAWNNWKELSPSRKKEVLRYMAQLKSAEARDRNIDRALHVLAGHSGRFMARDWKNGS